MKRPVKKCDAIVIFFCAFNDSRSDIDKDTYRRVNHAVDLYKDGIASHIICVGGARHKEKLYGSLMMKKILINKAYLQNRFTRRRHPMTLSQIAVWLTGLQKRMGGMKFVLSVLLSMYTD